MMMTTPAPGAGIAMIIIPKVMEVLCWGSRPTFPKGHPRGKISITPKIALAYDRGAALISVCCLHLQQGACWRAGLQRTQIWCQQHGQTLSSKSSKLNAQTLTWDDPSVTFIYVYKMKTTKVNTHGHTMPKRWFCIWTPAEQMGLAKQKSRSQQRLLLLGSSKLLGGRSSSLQNGVDVAHV